MKTTTLFLLAFLTTIYSFSQELKPENQRFNLQTGLSFEVHNMNNFGMSFGGIVGQNFGDRVEPNYSAGLYADVIFVDQPIIGQRLKLNLNYLGIFGVNFNFVNYYRDGKNDFRITPEINFSLYGNLNVFVGYNISTSDHSFDEIGKFRAGININLTK